MTMTAPLTATTPAAAPPRPIGHRSDTGPSFDAVLERHAVPRQAGGAPDEPDDGAPGPVREDDADLTERTPAPDGPDARPAAVPVAFAPAPAPGATSIEPDGPVSGTPIAGAIAHGETATVPVGPPTGTGDAVGEPVPDADTTVTTASGPDDADTSVTEQTEIDAQGADAPTETRLPVPAGDDGADGPTTVATGTAAGRPPVAPTSTGGDPDPVAERGTAVEPDVTLEVAASIAPDPATDRVGAVPPRTAEIEGPAPAPTRPVPDTAAPTPGTVREPATDLARALLARAELHRTASRPLEIGITTSDLGRVQVSAAEGADGLQLQLSSDRPDGRARLGEHLPELRRELDSGGVDVGSLEVGTRDAGREPHRAVDAATGGESRTDQPLAPTDEAVVRTARAVPLHLDGLDLRL